MKNTIVDFIKFYVMDVISSNKRLLEIAEILKLTENDHGNVANKIFPIIDNVFIRR